MKNYRAEAYNENHKVVFARTYFAKSVYQAMTFFVDSLEINDIDITDLYLNIYPME